MLELRSVDLTYPTDRFAIRALSTTFHEGDLISITGPNGSGKTTLLRLLARVLEPTAGEILFKGEPLGRWEPRRYARLVGYLPQDPDVSFPMRALEVVLTGRAPFLRRLRWESPEDRSRAEEALRECDALHLADRYLDEMSGGERKRVFLARVLAGTPELILLDEPFAALDLSHIQQLIAVLRSFVTRTGRTVIFVSHDLNWSGAYSDRMLVMSGGAIAADGPPAEVMRPEILERIFEVKAEAVQAGTTGRRWIVPRL